jgi:EpsD family peptidyl-prolyl cis-trans isomerase
MRIANQSLIILLACTSLVLVSCGKKEGSESKKNNSQVVAKVNGNEITIHQVNYMLSKMGALTPDQGKTASKQVVYSLVELQLLKQKAIEEKMDQDPAVLQALESSRDQILAQAYIQKQQAKAPKPAASEVDAFYNTHPELFSQRKVYRLQEIAAQAPKEKHAEIEASLKSIKGINEVAAWFKANGYPFSANANVKSAEQLPTQLLKQLQGISVGDFLVVTSDRGVNVVHIADAKLEAVDRVKAKPVIEQYFLNQNKATLAKKEMDALNEKAKIEFLGEFSGLKKSDLSKPAPLAKAESAESQSSNGAQDVKEKSATEAKPDASATAKSIEKGLAGL